jgi:hypothetical protein
MITNLNKTLSSKQLCQLEKLGANEIQWANMTILEKDYMSIFPKKIHTNEFWNKFSYNFFYNRSL